MSLARYYQPRDGEFRGDGKLSYGRNGSSMGKRGTEAAANYNWNYAAPCNSIFGTSGCSQQSMLGGPYYDPGWHDVMPSSKRRKVTNLTHESDERLYQQGVTCENGFGSIAGLWQHVPPQLFYAYCNSSVYNNSSIVAATRSDGASASTTTELVCSKFENDDEAVLMSRDEIERCSPSRKDGIDALQETHLRYSYCAFLQNLGVRLDLPRNTIGTAMVLCHRFFVRRSHASHDRFLIATAALFLASKSEETGRPLNDVLRVASEVLHKQDFSVLSYMFPIDWFEQYRERIIDAEQLILTTLNFEISVQHPYESLTSTLQKLGFSPSVLMNLALSLVSEGLRSSLWLQFKPQYIAAGAAYLAAKFLNMNLASSHHVWKEFHTPPSILRVVAHQLMELFD